MTTSKPDFLTGYKLAIENAKMHIDVALKAENISYGIANSHLILAAEEAIKALRLLGIASNKNANTDMKDVYKYFSSHTHKHESSKTTQEYVSFAMSFFSKIGKPDFSDWFKKAVSGTENSKSNADWWDQANSSKNLGFYVCMDDTSENPWQGPFSITKEQFEKSKSIVLEFIDGIAGAGEVYAKINKTSGK